jgi:hypothetical protein
LDDILRGEKSAEFFLNFLSKNNKTDMSILKVTKVRELGWPVMRKNCPDFAGIS